MKWADLDFFTLGGDAIVAQNLTPLINEGTKIFPDLPFILRALDTTSFDEVKVVILGQDPYPTEGHAHGLAFSVQPHVKPLPGSLRNIYKELKLDVGVERPNGDLSSWAHQGVLLLNTVLTVTEGKPGSHVGLGWEALTDEVIHKLSLHREHLVFVLWGRKAQEKAPIIDSSKHLVLKAAHPSPLSARNGFFGSKPFSRINAYLKQNGIQEIDWGK